MCCYCCSDLRCNECEYGFYNLDHDNVDGCSPCDCHPFGATNQYCDPATGQCLCSSLFKERQCNECIDGYYDFNDGCKSCECHVDGTVANSVCDKASGQCVCKQHANGTRCDECEHNYYNLGADEVTACVTCACDEAGSADSPPVCHMTSGQCRCKASVEGRSCNQCKAGSYNLTEDGCLPCGCDITGTVDNDLIDQSPLSCDQNTGLCNCLTNRYGRTCDKCNRSKLCCCTPSVTYLRRYNNN